MKYTNLQFDYDPSDYPDFCDAYVISGDLDGEEMTDEQLEELNNNKDLVYDLLIDYLF